MDKQITKAEPIHQMVQDLYDAIEWYDVELHASHALEAAVDNPHLDRGQRSSAESKRASYEKQLFERMDRLRLLTNALREIARRMNMPCAGLGALAKSLSHEPYAGDHFERPTDEIEIAADEAELIRAAVALVPPLTPATTVVLQATGEKRVALDGGWIGVSDAAKLIGVAKSTVSKWCNDEQKLKELGIRVRGGKGQWEIDPASLMEIRRHRTRERTQYRRSEHMRPF